MVSDIEGVQGLGCREMSNSMRDGICICVAVVVVVVALMVAVGVVVLMVVVGVMVLVIVVRVLCTGVVGVVGVLCIGAVEVNCTRVVDILVLGGVFVVEVVEGVELVVECVVRLVLWCANERGYFLCRFSLKLVEMNGLSRGGCLFGMVIWADCFVLLERGFLGKMVGVDVLMDVVVEVVVVEAVDVVQAGFLCLFQAWLFGGCDGCESGDGGWGWCGGVGVVELVCGLRICVGVGDVGNRGEGVVRSAANVGVGDGGEARCRDCYMFPNGIFGELWEDRLYRLPFMFDISKVFL